MCSKEGESLIGMKPEYIFAFIFLVKVVRMICRRTILSSVTWKLSKTKNVNIWKWRSDVEQFESDKTERWLFMEPKLGWCVCAHSNFTAKLFSSLLHHQVQYWLLDAQLISGVWWTCYIGGSARRSFSKDYFKVHDDDKQGFTGDLRWGLIFRNVHLLHDSSFHVNDWGIYFFIHNTFHMSIFNLWHKEVNLIRSLSSL